MTAVVVGVAVVAVVIILTVRLLGRKEGRTFSGGPGVGATGTIYDMLNEDKRKAIEIIVEGRAEYRDPETADDVPPEDEPSRDRP